MVQFKILSGKQAGATWAARRFPVRVGRGADCDLRLDEDGVWERHLVIHFDPAQGCLLSTAGEALARVNGDPVRETVLRNGDCITAGAVEIQFWLAEPRQSGLALREAITWGMVAAVFVAQAALLYWLVR